MYIQDKNEGLDIEPDSYMMPCPACGAIIPRNLKGCWKCGAVLDRHLRELKEALDGVPGG